MLLGIFFICLILLLLCVMVGLVYTFCETVDYLDYLILVILYAIVILCAELLCGVTIYGLIEVIIQYKLLYI